MYRNLEEDHKRPLAAAGSSDGASCPCQCKAPAEQDQEEKPAGNQAGTDLQVYYDYNGEPKP